MFTGIVREVGQVRQIVQQGDTKVRISCRRDVQTIDIGASIACNGVCLTVIAKGDDTESGWFDVEASAETCDKTTLGGWAVGRRINLEPALKLGDELGGHIVSGHVDGMGEITVVRPEGDSHRVLFKTSKALGKFIASKGSVTIDGISLTVNEVEDAGDTTTFGINVIPHTWANTTLSDAAAGAHVNLEIDLLARYVQRLAEAG
ncbi:MAG: riboflavin synthase [Pseudomonadota bacterium]